MRNRLEILFQFLGSVQCFGIVFKLALTSHIVYIVLLLLICLLICSVHGFVLMQLENGFVKNY